MNAEALAAGQPRILLPIIVRDEYLTGLRTLTRAGQVDTRVEVLTFGQRVTARVDFSSYSSALAALRATNCFEVPWRGVQALLPRDAFSAVPSDAL